MKILLCLGALLLSTAFAQTVCDERTPPVQKDVFRWIMSVSDSDKQDVSQVYFYGKKPGELSGAELSWSLVGFYTDEHYAGINKDLRNGVKNRPSVLLAEAINQSLCDFPVFEGEVYRGAELPKSAIDEYVEASTITLKSFTSTSKKEKVGCDFAENVIYKIYSRRGRVIEAASLKKFEKEVLFHKDTEFTVLKVSTDRDVIREETSCRKKGLTLIHLEEVAN